MREVKDEKAAEVISHGVAESRKFTMKADGWLFRNLMGNLYSDKVASVIREIVSNAIDSHAMSGCPDREILVHLPTAFDPNFTVRDFGAGMTHEFAMDLYSCVGHSEKRKTNTATGMFGLGSKSPFAVCDAFTITVYQKGKRRTYSAHYDETGAPTLSMLGGVVDTTEEDGVLVKVPVGKEDVHKFEAAVRHNAFAYYDKNVKFSRHLSGDKEEVLATVRRTLAPIVPSMFQITEQERNRTSRNVLIRQGTAIYPLDVHQLTDETRGSSRTAVLDLYTKDGAYVLFDAPIGTFSVTPSREALSYDKASVANISQLVTKALDAALEKIIAVVGVASDNATAYKRVVATYDAEAQKRLSGFNRARDVVRFAEQRVMRNFAALKLKNDDGVALQFLGYTNINTNDADVHGAQIYSGQLTKTYDGGADGHMNKVTSVRVVYPRFCWVVPHGLKFWERRVMHHLVTKCGYDVDAWLEFVVLRCRADVFDKVVETAQKCKDFVTVFSDVSLLPDVTIIGEEEETTGDSKRHPKNAVYTMTAHGEWSETKTVVDFSQPAYFVVRNGAQHDNLVFTSTTAETNFRAAKHWADLVDDQSPFATRGLTVRNTITNSALSSFINIGLRNSLLDPRLPIYRLTGAQHERIMQENTGLIPLVETVINGMTKHKEAYARAVLHANLTVPAYSSLAAWADSAIRKVMTRTASVAEKEVTALLVNDDGFMFSLLLYLGKMSSSCLTYGAGIEKMRQDTREGRELLSEINTMFDTIPATDIVNSSAIPKMAEKSVTRFWLVHNSAAISNGDNYRHVVAYIRAVTAGNLLPAFSLTSEPYYATLVQEIRDNYNNATKCKKVA